MATYAILVGWVLGPPILIMIGQTSVGRFLPAWWARMVTEREPILDVRGADRAIGNRSVSGTMDLPGGCDGAFPGACGLCGLATGALRPGGCRRDSVSAGVFLARPIPAGHKSGLFSSLLEGVSIAAALAVDRLALAIVCGGRTRLHCAGGLGVRGERAPAHAMGWSVQRFSGRRRAAPAQCGHARSAGRRSGAGQPRAAAFHADFDPQPGAQQVVRLLSRCALSLRSCPHLWRLAHAPMHERWLGAMLAPGMVLAHGAAVTSLGIALATWIPRVDRALIFSVAVSLVVTVAWIPLAALLFQGRNLSLGMASASPFLGVGLLTTEMVHASPQEWPVRAGWAAIWIVTFSGVAASLLGAALLSFDRCVRRVGPRAVPMRRLI